MSFGDAEYAGKRKKTRREIFLVEMDQVVPRKSLPHLIEPCYPMAGRGRHPYPLETMLRVHLMQNWFGLSDPAMEEALYEITPIRTFAGLTLSKAIPDETTILNFRHLLESSNVFRVYMPDTATGSCPAGMHPIYRAWNQRADVNHRFTMDPNVQETMMGRGHAAEGYGDPPVAMCSPL